MMKMLDRIAWIPAVMVLSLLAVSCMKEDMALRSDVRIVLTASKNTPIPTRAATDIQSTAFYGNERVNAYVTAKMDGSEDVVLGDPAKCTTGSATASGVNVLTPDVPMYYPIGDNVAVDIYGIYPSSTTKESSTFQVAQDQTDSADYKASDLMYARVSNMPATDKAINLVFNHMMAKLIVSAIGAEGVGIQQVRLKGIKRTISLDAVNGTLGSTSGSGEYIEMSNGGAALVPPQTVSGDFIEVITDKGTATFSVLSRNLESGKEYTINLVVGRQAINYTTTITAWNNDAGALAVATAGGSDMVIGNIDTKTYDYTLIPFEPTPAVTVNDVALTKDTDYTFQYFNNSDAGTAMVIAVGQNAYTNRAAVKTFIIRPQETTLSYTSSDMIVPYVINSSISNPLILKRTSDNATIPLEAYKHMMTYTTGDKNIVAVDQNGNMTVTGVGQTTITATLAAGNYNGQTVSFSVNVQKKTVDDLTITFDDNTTTYTYTGSAITPPITVKDGSITLLQGTHYTLSYSNNVNVSKDSSRGTILISGGAEYDGDRIVYFDIKQATTVITMEHTRAAIPEGAAISRPATTNFGQVVYKSSNPSIARVSGTGMVTGLTGGQATITASVTGNDNYTSASVSYQVVVVATETVYTVDAEDTHVYSFKCTQTGRYKLEVWGAQGGKVAFQWYRRRYSYTGGLGGYAGGIVKLNEGDELYIVVGGAGGDGSVYAWGSSGAGGAGGYNGGGKGGTANAVGGAGGGGATHIALKAAGNGLLSSINSSYVLIAAGGGSGAVYGNNGSPGGETGGYGQMARGNGAFAGGTASSGYAFGLGQSSLDGGNYGSSGAGGGWYGGYTNQSTSSWGTGGGGSGHIGASGYAFSDIVHKTGAQSGHGKAKITYLPE